MEFLNYRTIRAKLKKRGLLFKKPSIEDASYQFHILARQLVQHRLYSGYCHLAVAQCQANSRSSGQVGALLNAARSFAQAQDEVISMEDHVKLVNWAYTEALPICDRSFIRPIQLEMGRFYEANSLYQQAAECYKQSMCISKCVYNLIFAKQYKSALDELRNYPSHLMTTKDHTSLFLLELLLNEDAEDLNRNSLQILSEDSRTTTDRGLLPTDDHLFDLAGLLESLLILQKDSKIMTKRDQQQEQQQCQELQKPRPKHNKIKNLIANKLSAFLDPAQIQLLQIIIASPTC